MKTTLLLFAVATFVGFLTARDIPQNPTKPLLNGPSLEYEIINPALPKYPPVSERTESTNKTFIYDPVKSEWTVLKSTDPVPNEGTLVWNQNNDKWLTQAFRP